jgi:hypothetical protein
MTCDQVGFAIRSLPHNVFDVYLPSAELVVHRSIDQLYHRITGDSACAEAHCTDVELTRSKQHQGLTFNQNTDEGLQRRRIAQAFVRIPTKRVNHERRHRFGDKCPTLAE